MHKQEAVLLEQLEMLRALKEVVSRSVSSTHLVGIVSAMGYIYI